MQRILDTTEATLSQAFSNLAANGRREHRLYYATALALGTIIAIAALLLSAMEVRGFVAEKHRLLLARAASVDLFVRREASLIRYTEMAFRHDIQEAPPAAGADQPPDPPMSYTLVLPDGEPSAQQRRAGNLIRTLSSSMDAASALKAYSQIAILGRNPSFAAYYPEHPDDASRPPEWAQAHIDRLLAPYARLSLPRAKPGQPAPPPVWIGPLQGPEGGMPVMHAALAVQLDGHGEAVVAATVPVSEFLPPSLADGDSVALYAADGGLIAATATLPPEVGRAMAERLDPSRRTYNWGRHGLILTAPLSSGFGSLVYRLGYAAAAAAMATPLLLTLGCALALLALLVAGARHFDRHLLQRNRREAARALESETLNHILVNATPIGLMIAARPSLDLVVVNTVAQALTGMYTAETMPAALAADFQAHAGNDEVVSTFAKIYRFEHSLAGASAGRTLQITYAPAQYKRQDVLICAITDITAQKNIEKELRAARAASEQMMRTRSHFFASMSHEIRTPLHLLLGNIELFGRLPALTQAHRERLATLDTAAQSMLRLSNDILDLSKLDAGEMTLAPAAFVPAHAFEALLEGHAALSRAKGVRLHFSCHASCHDEIHADAGRILQIVQNLLANAIKFTHSGKVMLSARVSAPTPALPAPDRDARTAQAPAPASRRLEIEVTDSGIGIAPADLAKVFTPFQQGTRHSYREYGGTGLGLSICARLCQIMGGHIEVDSVQGVGSRFSVRLPVPEAKNATGASTGGAPACTHGRLALLCYRAIEYRDTFADTLRQLGYRVQAETALPDGNTLARLGARAVLVTDDFPADQRAALAEGLAQQAAIALIEITQDPLPAGDSRPMPQVAAWRPSLLAALLPAPAGHSPAGPASPDEAPDFLIVDDCALSRQLLTEQLAACGYRTAAHASGESALLALRQTDTEGPRAALPLAVLTDLDMPGMPGLELLHRIRQQHAALPVVAISASTQDEDVIAGLDAGFADYLGKPVSQLQLAALLQRLASPAPQTAQSSQTQSFMRKRWSYFNVLLPDELEALAQALQQTTPAALAAWLHKMRGALGVLDQPELGRLCAELEAQLGPALAPAQAATARALARSITALNEQKRQPDTCTPG
jgi:two-component system capsular synthesis sensor histidine kinase RcsC